MHRFLFALLVLIAGVVPIARAAETPSASEILASMDRNLQFDTRTATLVMRVVDSRRTREYRMLSYGRNLDEAAVEYLSPERDKGTRMLRLGEQLWLYMPAAERTQKISGHMLRQGMMGSDISYEDLLQGEAFEERYTAVVAGEEAVDGRPAWRIEASAKDPSVTYPKRVLWVDQGWRIPVKQELYALSGMLLKTWTMGEVRTIGVRQVPMRMEVRDALRQGSRTEIALEQVEFGVALEDEVFSIRWLERR